MDPPVTLAPLNDTTQVRLSPDGLLTLTVSGNVPQPPVYALPLTLTLACRATLRAGPSSVTARLKVRTMLSTIDRCVPARETDWPAMVTLAPLTASATASGV